MHVAEAVDDGHEEILEVLRVTPINADYGLILHFESGGYKKVDTEVHRWMRVDTLILDATEYNLNFALGS